MALQFQTLIAVTKLFGSRALAVCIQGTNEEGFLDVFLTLVAFPTFRLSFYFTYQINFDPVADIKCLKG